jgi:hypothetical protein
MAKWKLHIPDETNRISEYKCGLVAGQRVRLKKDLIITTQDGAPTDKVYRVGEEWVVLPGITTDPVLWFGKPDGSRHTWNDDKALVDEWFERI